MKSFFTFLEVSYLGPSPQVGFYFLILIPIQQSEQKSKVSIFFSVIIKVKAIFLSHLPLQNLKTSAKIGVGTGLRGELSGPAIHHQTPQIGRGRSLYILLSSRKKISLQLRTPQSLLETVTTQPMRSLHSLASQLPPMNSGSHSPAQFPSFPYKSIFSLLQIFLWLAIVCLSRTANPLAIPEKKKSLLLVK